MHRSPGAQTALILGFEPGGNSEIGRGVRLIMTDRKLRNLWDALQGRLPYMQDFLTEVRLGGADYLINMRNASSDAPLSLFQRGGVRGIHDLRVRFNYPVSVIAGESGSGKSTVLFAAACAYRVPGAGRREFVPSVLFPDYQPKQGTHGDKGAETVLQYEYSTSDGQRSMMWKRTTKGWDRSFLGRPGASQPERQVYLRTLGNLTNPSELLGILGMARIKSASQELPLTASQIEFAQRLLPFKYSEVIKLSGDRRKENLLVVTQENGAAYSEFHMAAGERAILRLSQDIAQAKGALVLIDEVEASLHPSAQKFLMLELQQLALRNDLQIIVTTHSPVVLDSVPQIGRIFLARNEEGEVSVHPPYRDLIQDVLYGRSDEKFQLLCEDEMADSLLQGVFDIIIPRLNARRGSIRIGRDMGAEEFPMYAKALERFGQVQNFIFVSDGDRRGTNLEQIIQKNTRHKARVVFLPGEDAPEVWVWKKLKDSSDLWVKELGIAPGDFSQQMSYLNSLYGAATDSDSNIAKAKLRGLSEVVGRSDTDICRMIARREAGRKESDIQPLVENLEMAFREWRRNI